MDLSNVSEHLNQDNLDLVLSYLSLYGLRIVAALAAAAVQRKKLQHYWRNNYPEVP